jgi:hypothetical protein
MGRTLYDLRGSRFGADPRHVLELGTLDRVARAQKHFRYEADSQPLVGASTGIVAITLAILRSTPDLSAQPSSIVTTNLRACSPPTQLTSDPTYSHRQLLRYPFYKTTVEGLLMCVVMTLVQCISSHLIGILEMEQTPSR